MNVTELRVGNYVNFGIVNEPIEVLSINPNSTTIEMASPIPLTEDWLLKFGFDKCGIDDEIRYYKDEYYIEFMSFKIQEVTICNLKYVHQLQNLYFALTQEELKYDN